MRVDDEKDYIMRMIKELARVLFSLMLGKKYVQVELPEENRFEVSGMKVNEYFLMVDKGQINEAENQILEEIDYQNRDEVAAATCFYQYMNQKNDDFLEQHSYSREEVLDGLMQLAKNAGYGELCDVLGD